MEANAGQLTPNQIAANLADLARELARAVSAIEHADLDAARKRAAFDLAFSQAFLAAEGSMDLRKHQAVVATYDQRVAAEVAETVVRHLRRRIDEIKTRVEVGRSVNSAIKTELNLAGLDGEA